MERTLIHGARLDSAPQCVFIANHLSALDIILLGAFIRRDFRWLAKGSLFKVPFVGGHLSAAGHIPVNRRGSKAARARVITQKISEAVEAGADILFFPEGTRSPSGALQPFRLGAFQAAVREGLPVVPLVIRGTHEALKRGDLRVHAARRCSVTVLPSLAPDASIEDPKAQAVQLKERAYGAMSQALHASTPPR